MRVSAQLEAWRWTGQIDTFISAAAASLRHVVGKGVCTKQEWMRKRQRPLRQAPSKHFSLLQRDERESRGGLGVKVTG